MPTTITSAGITFNDATSLTSANIGTAQLVNGSVTAAKLGTTEQRQIAKAWVNFNGVLVTQLTNGAAGSSLVVTNGSNQGTWNFTGAFNSSFVGTQWYLNIGGTNQTLGGRNVWTIGIRIIAFVSANQVTFELLDGVATSNQTVNGNGASTGYAYYSHGIRSSYNVSSVTKNGTGDYTVNFATAMADANYSVSGLSVAGSNGTRITYLTISGTSSPSVNAIRINNYPSGDGTGAFGETNLICIQVFGN